MSKLFKIALILLLIGLLLVAGAWYMGLDFFGFGVRQLRHEMQEMPLEQVKRIDANFEIVDLYVEKTDAKESKIIYPVYENKDYKVDISMDNARLSLDQKWPQLRFSFPSTKLPQVKILLAYDVKLEDLSLLANTGTIRTKGLEALSGNMRINAGEYRSDNDNFTDFEFRSDVGSIAFSKTKLKSCSVRSNVGEVSGSIEPSGNISVVTDVGEVKLSTIGNAKYSYSLTSDLGDAKFNGEEVTKGEKYNKEHDQANLEITSHVGSVELND